MSVPGRPKDEQRRAQHESKPVNTAPVPEVRPPIEVRCPGCGEPALYAASNPYRPFCSARCKNHDFGAWASEAYRVAAPPTSADAEDPEPT